MTRRLLFIVNPAAGGGRGLRLWRECQLEHDPGLDAETVFTRAPGHALDLARAAADRFEVLIAVGGDGTLSEVANGILQSSASETAVGLLPFGTGNDVAHSAGLGTTDAALAAVRHGRALPIDVIDTTAQQGDRTMRQFALSYAAVGFAAELLKGTTPTVKRIFGPRHAYLVGFLRALIHLQSASLEVRTDQRTLRGRWCLVAAGNAETVGGGRMRLSPGASLTDGQFNVNVIEGMSRWQAVGYFRQLLRGQHTRLAGVHYFATRWLRVSGPEPVPVQVDGELFGHTPATFALRPGGLCLLQLGHCERPRGSLY